MSWILDNPELSAGILTSIVLISALVFAYIQLKGMAKDRHAQIMLALSTDWRSDIMQRARKSLAEMFKEAEERQPDAPTTKLAEMIKETVEEHPDVGLELTKVADFFEDLGLLVNKKMLHPPELALETFAGSIILYWENYSKYVTILRDKTEKPDIYEWFEYLYRLSKAYSEAKATYKGACETRPSAKSLFGKLADLFK